MSDIGGVQGTDRDTLALIDALRDRGAVEVSVDGVYARFVGAPERASVFTQPEDPAAAVVRRLEGLLHGQERE